MILKLKPSFYYIGIFAGVFSVTVLIAGCGAGTGQSLNSPGLSSRSAGDTGTGSGGANGAKGVANSVLPAKRMGLFVADYVPGMSKTPGAAQKPPTFTRADAGDGQNASDYAHVFVTVHAVELVSTDDQAFSVWADDAGRVVDLAALRENGGERVALLGGVSVPGVSGKKTYKRARITLGKSVTLVKKGETSAKPTAIDDAVGRDDEGRPVLTVLLDRPRDLGNGKESLVIAFDRTSFTFADGRVTPVLREGRGSTSLDPVRQEATTFTGTVSESAANGDGVDRVFAVTPDGGARGETQVVWLRSSAPFYRADGKPSPALIDGARVAVRGKLESSTKRVLAESVTVLPDDEKAGDIASVTGTTVRANPEGGSLTVAVNAVRGAEPAYSETTVTLGEDAVLRSPSGLIETKDAFFAALKNPGPGVEADGEYEPTTGVLTATRLRRTTGSGDAKREATVLATAKTVTGNSLTVVAPLLEWDGIVPPASGKAWTVTTSPGTVCVGKDGKTIPLADLLTAAQDPDTNAVRVVGAYAGGSITASRLEIRPVPPKETVAAKPAKGAEPGDAPAKPAKKRKPAPTDADADTVPKTEASPAPVASPDVL